MKNKTSKLFQIIKSVFIFICVLSLLFGQSARAAGNWYYWVTDEAHEMGINGGSTGYATKDACENSLEYKNIGAGHEKSNGCYSGGPVTISGFTLDAGGTGKAGEYFTLSGTNFIRVTQVLIGTTVADVAAGTGFTSIRVGVPKGAVTGKITVKTTYRGTAVSRTNFVVGETPVNNNPWAFVNVQKQYMGPYTTEKECKAAHIANNKAVGVVKGSVYDTDACTQQTLEDIKKSQILDVPGGTPADLSVNNIPVSDPDTYTLLAPLPGLDKVQTNDLGKYFNIIFNIIIGLCGALAVIMIIIGGVQYMGDESVFGKTEAKSKIISAILGLFIALGAFALLNTINPALTGKDGLTIDQVTAQIDEESESTPPNNPTYTGSGSSKLCNGGYTDVTTYDAKYKLINVCKSIGGFPVSVKLQQMLDAAKKDSVILTGSGSRSYATQVSLRITNHCADTYTASSSTCKPPTARPGHSNHEIGGAVDFTCSGGAISSHNSPCYIWLAAHASEFKFYNLKTEPWHWSFNGK